MKKNLCFIILLLATITGHAYDPIQQWMLFRSNYSYVNNKVDMSSNLGGNESVNAIAQDGNGNIYLATSGSGLRMFDGKKLLVPALPKESYALRAEILSLAVDSKNTLWVGTSEGLAKFDGNEWTNITPDITGLNAITEIAVTATDKVYIAGFASDGKHFTNGGLSFYNGNGWVNFNKGNTDLPNDTLQDLTIDKDGYLWMTLKNHNAGLARFDGKTWKVFNTANTEAIPSNVITGIATNKSGTLWFPTKSGILAYENGNFKLTRYNNGFGKKLQQYTNGDGSVDATGLTVEDDGTIWLATQNKGVIHIHDKFIKGLTPENSLLNSAAVLKTLVDKDNRKWFVTGSKNVNWAKDYFKKDRGSYLYSTGGVTVFKENNLLKNPDWTVFTETNSDLKLGNTFSISEDKSGNVWIPLTGDGLVKFKDGNFTTYKPDDKMAALTKAFIADDGKIYLATTMKGVKVFDNGTFTEYAKWPNMGGVNDMAFDKDNTFWVTGTGGVSRRVNNDWETFNKKNGDLPTVIFYSILKDSKGMLWVGSAKGLMKYDGTAWTVISKKEVQFPSDDITALAEDKEGKLWVGTKSGLSIFDGNNWTHISKIESPKVSKFQVNNFSFDQKGNIWIATEQDGLLKYDGKSAWTQFDKKNTGTIFNKVPAVKAASDGKVYMVSEYYQFNDTDFIMPSQSQEYNIQVEVNKRIKDADPKYVMAIISGQ
jgi:ligand-binding sensor domain-containing protein